MLSCTSLVELAKLLLILPTSPILKVDESTGILSRSVASSICRSMLSLIVLITLIINVTIIIVTIIIVSNIIVALIIIVTIIITCRITLGQTQKLMKKSTRGEPGMWRRCRT